MLLLLSVLLIVSVAISIRTYIKDRQIVFKQKQQEKRIQELESMLHASKDELTKNMTLLNDAREHAVTDVYASPVVAQINQGIVCIDKHGTIQLINRYAKQYIDDMDPMGKPYQTALHIQKADGNPDYSAFEAGFSGKTGEIPDTTEIVGRHGKVPIIGSVIPLEPVTTGSVLFVFSDNSAAAERKKEEQAFFSAAAHELRTPLTVIRLTISLLQSKYDTLGREKITEYLRRTNETSESLVRLVNDFLNVSRIDQGRLQVAHEPFDIVTLTDEVIKELDLLVRERNLYIHHEPAATEARMVVGDKGKAKEVLINLISNSIKYTVQGGLTITHEANESFLATKVTDTGGGIPLESQGLLFKRFLQIGSAKGLASTKSSGFGLYLSKRFALLMHGDIKLEKSEPGKGSTFTFTLPLA